MTTIVGALLSPFTGPKYDVALVKLRVCDTCGVVDHNAPPKTKSWAWTCKDHLPALPECERCGQDTRPYGAAPRKWPDTVARGRTTPHLLCQACAVYFRTAGSISLEYQVEFPSGHAEAALELLERHNALDLAEILGLEGEYYDTARSD